MVDELDAAAVASELGVTPVKVRVIQSRALVKLRRFLENNGGCLDKRFRLFPFPAVAELGRRLGELFPWRFSDGRSPRLRRLVSHRPTFPSPSPSVVEAGSWSLSGVSQSVAVLLLAAGVGASSLVSVPQPPPTPVVPSAPATVSAPPSSASVTSLPYSPASGRVPAPPPPKGVYGQVSTRGIHQPHDGVLVAVAGRTPTTSAPPSDPDEDTVTPAPSPSLRKFHACCGGDGRDRRGGFPAG